MSWSGGWRIIQSWTSSRAGWMSTKSITAAVVRIIALGSIIINENKCAFICYLQALVFRERGAIGCGESEVCGSARLYPTFWSAWQGLVDLCDEDTIANLRLPRDHWCYQWFIAGFNLRESKKNVERMQQFDRLSEIFKRSSSIFDQVRHSAIQLERVRRSRRVVRASD